MQDYTVPLGTTMIVLMVLLSVIFSQGSNLFSVQIGNGLLFIVKINWKNCRSIPRGISPTSGGKKVNSQHVIPLGEPLQSLI